MIRDMSLDVTFVSMITGVTMSSADVFRSHCASAAPREQGHSICPIDLHGLLRGGEWFLFFKYPRDSRDRGELTDRFSSPCKKKWKRRLRVQCKTHFRCSDIGGGHSSGWVVRASVLQVMEQAKALLSTVNGCRLRLGVLGVTLGILMTQQLFKY